MTLLNPRSAERDNQNSLRKYPFSDAATCGNATCAFVPGAIVDAQLYIPYGDPSPVWVSSVTEDRRLLFSCGDVPVSETVAPAVPNTAVPVVFTGCGCRVPGGVVVFGNKDDTDVLLSMGGQKFSREETELAASAVTFTGLPGVSGFLLDDGNVVFGDVVFKGANGCTVYTHTTGGKNYIRLSAIGAQMTEADITPIKKIVAESDNSMFVVHKSTVSDHVIEITAAGAAASTDDEIPADQNNVCKTVRKTIGTIPSEAGTLSPAKSEAPCTSVVRAHRIILGEGGSLTLIEGAPLGDLPRSLVPTRSGENRFAGYYDPDGKLYYRYDGTGIGKFTATADVTLHAKWIQASSRAEITFVGYGTLHLSAPSQTNYENPVRISGCENPTAYATPVSDTDIQKGGGKAVYDLALHPVLPDGSVTISIRGLEKVIAT